MAFRTFLDRTRLLLIIAALGLPASSYADSNDAPPALVPHASTPLATPCWPEDGPPATPEAIRSWSEEIANPVQVAQCLGPLLIDTDLREAVLAVLDFAAFRALGQSTGPLFSETLITGWDVVAPTQRLPEIVFSGGPWHLPQQIQALLDAANALEATREMRRDLEFRLLPLLGRCGGPGAVEWLENRSSTPGLADASIQALAQVGTDNAHAALARIAKRGDGQRRNLAIACLSLAPASTPLNVPLPTTPSQAATIAAHYLAKQGIGPAWHGASASARRFETDWALYAADSLVQQGNPEAAAAMLQDTLDKAVGGQQRRAALLQLARVSPDDARDPAISLAQDRIVGADARAILAADDGAASTIRRAYAQGDTGLKAALLEVIARHNDQELHSLLNDAANSPSPMLRFLAMSLSGQETSPQDALDMAKMGPHWLQHRALRALLDSFHGEAIAGDKRIAARGFRALADSDAPMWCRAEALEALGRIGTMEDLPFLEHYRPHAELGRAASTALARIAAQATEAGEAQATLDVLRETTAFQEAVEAAAAVMIARGVAGQEIAKAQGYITRWKALGPFRRVMSVPPFLPPRESDPPREIVSGEETFQWRPLESSGIPACVSLDVAGGTATYFAYAEVLVSTFESVRIEVRATGPWKLWINGEAMGEGEAVHVDSRYIPHSSGLLNPGINRVLLQLFNDKKTGQFCVRVRNHQGRPIDLFAQEMPESGASQVGLGRSAAESILNTTP